MRVGLLAVSAAVLASAAFAEEPPPGTLEVQPLGAPPITGALLQGLDKTTAQVSKFVAPMGKTVTFGTLQITVKDCRKTPPEENPESAAFLTIDESHPGDNKLIHWFSGWMFASSPAVSALQHPVYDVWLLDCSTETGSSPNNG